MKLEDIERMAVSILKTNKEHLPCAILIGQKEDRYSIGMISFPSDIDVEILKRIVKEENVLRYYIILETWVSLDGKRAEALLIAEFNISGKNRIVLNCFGRTESGKIEILDRQECSCHRDVNNWDVFENEIQQ
jgi:hypothetical protein